MMHVSFLYLFFAFICFSGNLQSKLKSREIYGDRKDYIVNRLFPIKTDQSIKIIAPDGTLFLKEKNNLIRIVNGKKQIIRNLAKEEKTDPTQRTKSVDISYMAALNKDKLYCMTKISKGGKPTRMPDGTYVVPLLISTSSYVEMWNGKSWKRMGGDFGFALKSKIELTESGQVYLFLDDVFSGDKLLVWKKSKWKQLNLPPSIAKQDVISFSVSEPNKIWFIVKDRTQKTRWWWPFNHKKNIFCWDGEEVENIDCQGNWVDISSTADGTIFVIDEKYRLYKLFVSESDVPSWRSLFFRKINDIKSFFANLFRS